MYGCTWLLLSFSYCNQFEMITLLNKHDFLQAENSCRVIERHGHRLLVSLVGDSLLEPFWPTGTGCARGFFGGLDACWLMRQFAVGECNIISLS